MREIISLPREKNYEKIKEKNDKYVTFFIPNNNKWLHTYL